jgi:hypothetical protein
MDVDYTGVTFEQEKVIRGILRGLNSKLEEVPKSVKPMKNDLAFTTRTTAKGNVVAEFRISGAGLPLRTHERANNRHSFVKLEFDLHESSCTARICPAIIPGMKLADASLEDGSEIREKQRVIHDAVRDILNKSDLSTFKILFGGLRDPSYRSSRCPFSVKNQKAASAIAAR